MTLLSWLHDMWNPSPNPTAQDEELAAVTLALGRRQDREAELLTAPLAKHGEGLAERIRTGWSLRQNRQLTRAELAAPRVVYRPPAAAEEKAS